MSRESLVRTGLFFLTVAVVALLSYLGEGYGLQFLTWSALR